MILAETVKSFLPESEIETVKIRTDLERERNLTFYITSSIREFDGKCGILDLKNTAVIFQVISYWRKFV